MSVKAQKATTKRIQTVSIKRMFDDSPDTSWLGEYSNSSSGLFVIDRDHGPDCPMHWADNDCTDDDERDCSCISHDSRTFRYFHPGSVEKFDPNASWIPAGTENKRTHWFDAMQDNAEADYRRMEALNEGDFCFIGIRAEARIVIENVCQDITSGGLWGIESDSDAAYLKEIESEQLAELRSQLEAIGFSKRAVSAAFRNVEREEL